MATERKDMTEMKFREFVIRGKVYSGNDSHARHSVYWAIRNSEADSDILISDIEITEGEENK
jgi:hypothetical protein